MSDPSGHNPLQNGSRPAIKSPRAALEPESAPPPPPASRHARNQWVVIGNLIIAILLVGLVGGMGRNRQKDQAEHDQESRTHRKSPKAPLWQSGL